MFEILLGWLAVNVIFAMLVVVFRLGFKIWKGY